MSLYHKGYALLTEPDKPDQEFDTFMCCHGGEIIIVRPSKSEHIWSPPTELAFIGQPQKEAEMAGKRRRGICYRCMGMTCGRPQCIPCIPFEAKLEAIEGSRRFWKQTELTRA